MKRYLFARSNYLNGISARAFQCSTYEKAVEALRRNILHINKTSFDNFITKANSICNELNRPYCNGDLMIIPRF